MAYSEIESDKPMFSVIMPLYDKEAYVERALRSVISQSFKNWELIVVNDGCTDNSYIVASNVIVGDCRCRIISQANTGVGAARNHGVAESSGKYLCFLDADDWWKTSFLKEMALFVEDYPDAGIWACNYWYVRNRKNRKGVNTEENGYINYPKMYYSTGNMPVWTGAVCMTRNIFEEFGGFPIKIKLGEDFLLWSKVAMKYKIAFFNKSLAFYNNDVPKKWRLTRNLHNPNEHMLWHLSEIEESASRTEEASDWKFLFDNLRLNGLLDYWLDKRFHDIALVELNKIRGTLPPIYSKPIWFICATLQVKHFGSAIKQLLRR